MGDLKPQSFRVIVGDGGATDTDDSATEHVGAFLREARESTGRDIDDIAVSLRIHVKFLRSIEEGRYEDLPGPTYAAGFIRSYSDHLGLDTESLVAQFRAESSADEGGPDLDFPAPSTIGWFPTGKVVASCAVLAAAVFGGWFFLQTGDSIDVAAVPAPPGFKSSVVAPAANQEPARAFAAAVESPLPAAPADDISDTAADLEPELGTVVQETPAISGEAASSNSEQPSAEAAPVTALVSPEPAASEAEPSEATEPKAETPAEQGNAAAPPATVTPIAAETPAPKAEPPVVEESEVAPAAIKVPGSAAVPAPAPAPRQPVLEIASLPVIRADNGARNTDNDGRTFGTGNDQARVVIGAKDDSWVQVLDEEQNVVLTRLLRAGDRYMVPNRNDLVMLTGNAGGLIISVDGKPVPQIGSDGAILHNVRLDADMLKAGRAVIQ